MHPVETLTVTLRQSLQIGGAPNGHDLHTLLADFGRGLRVRRDPAAPGPFLLTLAGGRAVLTLPPELDRHAEECAVLHELGHRLLSGAGIGLFPHSRNGGRTERADEAQVERFVRAWKLPADLLSDYTDEELADLSGFALETVRQRRKEVLGL
jgi:hypothetical protein